MTSKNINQEDIKQLISDKHAKLSKVTLFKFLGFTLLATLSYTLLKLLTGIGANDQPLLFNTLFYTTVFFIAFKSNMSHKLTLLACTVTILGKFALFYGYIPLDIVLTLVQFDLVRSIAKRQAIYLLGKDSDPRIDKFLKEQGEL